MDCERYLPFKARLEAPVEGKQSIKYAYTELIEKEGKGGRPTVTRPKALASLESEEKKEYEEYAMVTRDRIDAKGDNESTELEIQSEIIRKTLRDIISRRSQPGTFADPIIFQKPYYPLFHCRDEIKKRAASETNTEEENRHLGFLTDFMSEKLKDLEKVQRTQVEKRQIEFKHLGILFEAGCLVIGSPNQGKDKGEMGEKVEKTDIPECFVFQAISDELEDAERGGKYVEIQVLQWGFNGTRFGFTVEKLKIAEFPGSRNIVDLECYPWSSMKEEKKIELFDELVARGIKWHKYLKATSCVYQGTAEVPEKADFAWTVRKVTKDMSGRVLLDHSAFMEAFPQLNTPLQNSPRRRGSDDLEPHDIYWDISSTKRLRQGALWSGSVKDEYKMSDAEALLCPARSPGYSLAQNAWGLFDVDRLEPMDWTSNTIRELAIDPSRKELLKALITEHRLKSKSRSANVVSKKGEGLMFLLYGPPGCGKTLTAELLAEEERIPLIRISSGDLGNYAFEIDRNLGALLKLAFYGSAIVLIDEADTFLAKRAVGSGQNYYQNAITSVFLKHLEYFPGVIFLTTNQRAEFDEAVSSRVILLRYEALDEAGMTRVWKNNLLKGKEGPEREAIKRICEDLGKELTLDGRQIKTLAYISLAWSNQKKEPISKERIKEWYCMTHPPKKPLGPDSGP